MNIIYSLYKKLIYKSKLQSTSKLEQKDLIELIPLFKCIKLDEYNDIWGPFFHSFMCMGTKKGFIDKLISPFKETSLSFDVRTSFLI